MTDQGREIAGILRALTSNGWSINMNKTRKGCMRVEASKGGFAAERFWVGGERGMLRALRSLQHAVEDYEG